MAKTNFKTLKSGSSMLSLVNRALTARSCSSTGGKLVGIAAVILQEVNVKCKMGSSFKVVDLKPRHVIFGSEVDE